MSKRYTTNSFIEKLKILNPNITVLEEYKTSSIPIHCKCNICNFEWYPTPNKLLCGRGCPKCANQKRGIRKTAAEINTELKKKNPSACLIGSYINGHTKTQFKCELCGNIWSAPPYSVLAGHGCPKCSHSSTSFAEQYLYESLKQLIPNTEVLNRNKKAIGKELDIYIPDFRLAIEFNGWAWHKNKLDKDIEKYNLCIKNGINILFIYDSCPLKELPLKANYLLYPFDLGLEPGNTTLREIVLYFSNMPEFKDSSIDIKGIDWDVVYKNSIMNSRMKTTDQFINELKKINENITVLGEYKKSSIPIHCKCNICQFEWDPTPNGLLRGNGCPQCSHRLGWKADDLALAIKDNNVHFRNGKCVVIGENVDSGKIMVKCNVCERQWMARYTDLLRGHGCGCSSESNNRVIKGKNDLITKAPNLLKEWNYEKNGDLEPANIAARSSNKIWWKCSVCGHEWQAVVSTRTAGSGCPRCYKEGRKPVKKQPITISLQRADPLLAKQWSPKNTISPSEISPNSKKKVYWICENGHEWDAAISNRYRGSGCPYCNRKKPLPGYTDLKTTNPDIASEWDYSKNDNLTPDKVLNGSHKKVWWICKTCGHNWQAVINDRTNDHGCPKCAKMHRNKKD